MNVDQLKGCATALLTPFRNGEVDYDAYTKWCNVRLPAVSISSWH